MYHRFNLNLIKHQPPDKTPLMLRQSLTRIPLLPGAINFWKLCLHTLLVRQNQLLVLQRLYTDCIVTNNCNATLQVAFQRGELQYGVRSQQSELWLLILSTLCNHPRPSGFSCCCLAEDLLCGTMIKETRHPPTDRPTSDNKSEYLFVEGAILVDSLSFSFSLLWNQIEDSEEQDQQFINKLL